MQSSSYSITYYFPAEDGGKHRVRKQMFLSTLRIKRTTEFKVKMSGNILKIIPPISLGKGKYARMKKHEKDSTLIPIDPM